MRPLHDKVLIERIVKENTTKSGIVLTRSDGPDVAKIIAVGPEVKDVSVGEIVLLDWNKAVKAQDFYVVKEEDIVFVYEDYNV
jgi:chaperonin GroES